MRKIKLSQGKYALIDNEDFDFLSQWKWCFHRKPGANTGYARRSIQPHYMHRLLLGALSGQLVDHRDGNGLNNRRNNIRLATQAQNQWNRKNLSSGVTCKEPGRRKSAFIARARLNGKRYHLGYFKTRSRALAAVDIFRKTTRQEWMP